jgi:hypothetical protein
VTIQSRITPFYEQQKQRLVLSKRLENDRAAELLNHESNSAYFVLISRLLPSLPKSGLNTQWEVKTAAIDLFSFILGSSPSPNVGK